jgi:Holliday junction resolvasome RuvABC endonuclease subunit
VTVAGGFDPGTAKSAIGLVERDGNRLKLLHRALIITKPDQPDNVRKRIIWSAISGPVLKYHPTVLGIEDQSQIAAAARGRANNDAKKGTKGARGFNIHNDKVLEVVGLVQGVAFAYGVRYKMLGAQSVKVGVLGKGGRSGDKKQMIAAIKVIFPELNEPGVKLSEHEADALAIAILALRVDLTGELA